MKKDKKPIKDWKIIKWLKENGKENLGKGLEAIGENTSIPVISGLLDGIGESLQGDIEISNNELVKAKELMKQDLEAFKLHNENTKNARLMQMKALDQDDKFSKRFIYYLAGFWSIASVIYFFFATFTEVKNVHLADVVLGFLLGTIVATIINFFFGSSEGSKDKTKIIDKWKEER